MQNKVLILLFLFAGIGNNVLAQKKFKAEAVVDPDYGIAVYDRFNMRLAGDSVRKENGVLASGWIEDFYTSGKLLHKGYYVDGKLKLYKNYFENENLEREFKPTDDYKSTMKVYYSTGVLRSEIYYEGENARIWKDFYSNGLLEYWEEYDKKFEYYVLKKFMYENGNIKDMLSVLNASKKLFTKKVFFENGTLNESGLLHFNKNTLDYEKEGKWEIYDETGRLIGEQNFVGGQVIDK